MSGSAHLRKQDCHATLLPRRAGVVSLGPPNVNQYHNNQPFLIRNPCTMSQDTSRRAPRLITAREAARCIGITKSTFYDWLARGYLPCHRFGRTIRVNTSDLEAYLVRTRMNELATPSILEAQRASGLSLPEPSKYSTEQPVQ